MKSFLVAWGGTQRRLSPLSKSVCILTYGTTVACVARVEAVRLIRTMVAGAETGLAPLLLPDPAWHKVDIVFVHGLNGHRSRSWTNQASELWPLWLRDDLEGTRAWTYGYDASITIGSKDSIKLHSIRFLEDLIRNGVGKSVCC